MSLFATPYDGTSRLFRIGTQPLDPAQWIVTDTRLAADLAAKEALLATRRDEVVALEPGTEAALAELRDLLVAHLEAAHRSTHRRHGETMEVLADGRRIALGDTPPLVTAARLVQDDLVLMRRGATGWRLAAAVLCAPSSWRLAEKFGRPIHEVHAPVPGFSAGTRNGELIARMFDNMRPETPMVRWNWSLYGDDALFHPGESPPRRFGEAETAERVFLRVERQTLRRLEQSGDIAFLIRVAVDPLELLERHSGGERIAAAIADQIEALDDAQLDYKGLSGEKERLIRRLRRLAPAP
jgi:hypothetical protein